MVESGAVLHGKYRIEQVLGRGGMGVVARARHLDLDQPVALKLLRPDVLQNQNAVERFRREGRAMVQLRSEHVCRVHDVGTLDSGAPYMVMEYLEGKDLGLILRERGRLAPGFAVDLVLQACEALAEAHALGIVHRDIKPANCFVTCGPDGEPLLKVLDFGIAKALGAVDDGITTSQSLIGSPSYMSPEQMRSSKYVDARTDIWALGVVLYELVSGRRPFEGDSFAGMCLAVTTTPMVPLDDVALPDGLAAVIARCLEKRPDERFGSMAELSAALARYAGTSAQGERSSTRTARMLERASSPALALSGMGVTTADMRRRQGRGTRSTADEPAPGSAPELTVTASVHERASTTGRTTRPLLARARPALRQRGRWLLIPAGLGLCALILGVMRGAGASSAVVDVGGDPAAAARISANLDAGVEPSSTTMSQEAHQPSTGAGLETVMASEPAAAAGPSPRGRAAQPDAGKQPHGSRKRVRSKRPDRPGAQSVRPGLDSKVFSDWE